MTRSTQKLNREKALALPVLELDASAIIPAENIPALMDAEPERSWWFIALELALAACILLFFL